MTGALDKVVDLLLQFIRAFQVLTVVDQFERAVVLRFGRYSRTLSPGLHWVAPLYIEQVLTASVVPDTRDLRSQQLTTLDGVSVTLGVVLLFSVTDVKRFLLDVEDADTVILNATKGAIAGLVSSNTYDDLVSFDVAQEIANDVRDSALRFGINIEEVGISDFCRCKAYRILGVELA